MCFGLCVGWLGRAGFYSRGLRSRLREAAGQNELDLSLCPPPFEFAKEKILRTTNTNLPPAWRKRLVFSPGSEPSEKSSARTANALKFVSPGSPAAANCLPRSANALETYLIQVLRPLRSLCLQTSDIGIVSCRRFKKNVFDALCLENCVRHS